MAGTCNPKKILERQHARARINRSQIWRVTAVGGDSGGDSGGFYWTITLKLHPIRYSFLSIPSFDAEFQDLLVQQESFLAT